MRNKSKNADQAEVIELEPVEVVESKELVEQKDQLPATMSEGAALIQMIERAASNPEIDIDKMKEIMAMKNEHEDRIAEREFNQAMAACQNELESIVHNKRNDQTKSGYADLNAVHAAAKPIWTRHGFSVISRTAPSEIKDHTRVLIDVRHAGGHKEHYSDDWPLDLGGLKGNVNKTPIQAKGSTSQYARRYSECMIFDLAMKGEDNDGNAQQSQNQLSDAAGDWVAAINECTDSDQLRHAYEEAYKALAGDNYGRNQIMRAKDATKAKIEQS